jgi:hypothetical protein
MKIIFDTDTAKNLSINHVVLELDTIVIDKQSRIIYCLVDDCEFDNFKNLEILKNKHQQFIDLYKKQDYSQCKDLLFELKQLGFNDMNSYYDCMQQRLEKYF